MKTKIILGLIFISCLPLSSFAKSPGVALCEMTTSLRRGLEVTGLNIANYKTTRTPEGGSYTPKEVKCIDGDCQVINVRVSPILTYEPGHPDANKEGYVAYPNIDFQLEKTKFQLLAERLSALAEQKKCGTSKGLSSKSFASIYYSNDKASADMFVKNVQGEIIIWESHRNNSVSILNLINGKSGPTPLPGDTI